MIAVFYLFFLFFIIIVVKIIIANIPIIIATPVQPKTETILLPRDIIIPASNTPSVIAEMLVLKSSFKKLAANVPVQAPVPGSGIPTNISNAQKIPLFPADRFSFSPPFHLYPNTM